MVSKPGSKRRKTIIRISKSSKSIKVSSIESQFIFIEEQIERNQLFFVLEQFFAVTKANEDPLNKAQGAITEYFKDTENTYFFDKNKIQ
jgi:hypothetical protein